MTGGGVDPPNGSVWLERAWLNGLPACDRDELERVERLGMNASHHAKWSEVEIRRLWREIERVDGEGTHRFAAAEEKLAAAAMKVSDETAERIAAAVKKSVNGSWTITKTQQATWTSIGIIATGVAGAALRALGVL